MFAATAAVPSPALDGLLVAWRGARLVRQVAALHGMRPGLFGTFALLRRVLFSAAGVVVADVAANTITRGPNMPHDRYYSASVLHSGKIYVVGGTTQLDSKMTTPDERGSENASSMCPANGSGISSMVLVPAAIRSN